MEIFKTVRTYIVVFSCLTLGVLPLSSACFAQNAFEAKDTLKAEQYYVKAVKFKEAELLDSTISYAQQAAQIYAKAQLWEKWYECKWEVYYSLYLQSEFEQALDQLHQDSVETIPKTNSLYFSAKINDWIGLIYYRQGVYKKALKYHLAGVELLEQAGHPKGEYGNLINIGIIYTMQGDYDLAITYFKRAEAVNLKNNNILRRIYYNLGRAYKANQEYEKAAEVYKKWGELGGEEESLNFFLGEIALDAGHLEQALDYTEKALKGYTLKEWNTADVLTLKGQILIAQKKHEEALTYLQKGLALATADEDYSDRDLNIMHIEFGHLCYELGKLDLALSQYDQALTLLNAPLEAGADLSNIDLAVGVWIMEAFIGKGNVFEKHFFAAKNSDDLKSAIDYYESAFAVIDHLRQHYNEATSITTLTGYAHPIYEAALKATMLLYTQTGNEEALNRAFVFSQKTKAFLLAASLQNITALDQGGIPEHLAQQEKELNQVIMDLGQDIAYLKKTGSTTEDSLEIVQLEAERFQHLREFQKFKAQLEEEYARYYQLKYENKVATTDEVRQRILTANTALIDYFLGDSSLFIVTITKGKTDFREIKRNEELDQAIQAFIHQAGNAQFASQPEVNFSTFTQSGHYLYQKLLQEPLKIAGPNIDQLIIIPDGILGILPFEALLTAPPQQSTPDYSFANLSYLLEDYVINYHYAPQILLDQKKTGKAAKHHPFLLVLHRISLATKLLPKLVLVPSWDFPG